MLFPAAPSALIICGRRLTMPQAWITKDGVSPDVINTAWWKQFQDPVLDGLIETALRENKDLLIAAARVEEFLGLYAETRSALFPQIGAGAVRQQAAGDERNPQ